MIDWGKIGRESLHPTQARIIEVLGIPKMDGRLPKASPTELAGEFDEPLGNVSYHVKTLHERNYVELVGTRPRRGATEHFYCLHPRIRAPFTP